MNRRAFTLIELIVAVGLMGLIIAFSSIIFRFGIDAHRVSAANAEIMQKARAITEQLNSDFKGLRRDAPMVIWFFRAKPADEPDLRADQIMFFADGEFTSMQSYSKSTGEPVAIDNPIQTNTELVRGNLARIHYAHTEDANNKKTWELAGPKRTLGRRCHIITDNNDLDDWPRAENFDTSFPGTTFGQYKNEVYEHDRMSLNEWKKLDRDDFEYVFDTAFFNSALNDERRPVFDTALPETFHKLLCEGVGSFAVQWAYWDRDSVADDYELRWFPSRDPDGDGDFGDSHFGLSFGSSGDEQFGTGVFFNIPYRSQYGKWFPVEDIRYRVGNYFERDYFPTALKFTFTVYDSKGIIEGGRTFTHIVYLED
jgi:prepilin-type N-terminal cleavage/methylation domain-containing protein